MGWSVGYDSTWERDIGYGVPATCDHPGCTAKIDLGLGYVCGGEPYGGEHGCGLFICSEHTRANRHHHQLCQHCADRRRRKLQPSPDTREWMRHKLTDPTWQDWRDENPFEADALEEALVAAMRERMIPQMTDPLGRHWRQPADIREAPMDDTHVLLTPRQVAGLSDYSRSYPSGTYDGKCWKREGEDDEGTTFWYLCWYQPHPQPGKIGIGFRIILEVEGNGGATDGAGASIEKP